MRLKFINYASGVLDLVVTVFRDKELPDLHSRPTVIICPVDTRAMPIKWDMQVFCS